MANAAERIEKLTDEVAALHEVTARRIVGKIIARAGFRSASRVPTEWGFIGLVGIRQVGPIDPGRRTPSPHGRGTNGHRTEGRVG